MQKFIGTKIVKAKEMTLGEYNTYRGWAIPENENPEANGFLVEYSDGGKPNHPDHAGYISWSPYHVFVKSYKDMGKMDFGHAITMLKVGEAVARHGWNGKEMFLYLVPANEYPAQTGIAKEFWGEDALVPYGAYIAMKTAQGNVVPWLASQTDVLATDWMVVKPATHIDAPMKRFI